MPYRIAVVSLLFAMITVPAIGAPARVVLPTNVQPSHYDIHDRDRRGASELHGLGQDRRRLPSNPPRTIKLNAADLAFGKVSLSGEAAAPKVAYDAKEETATLTFQQAVRGGASRARHRLSRQDQPAGRGPLRPRLRHGQGQEARAVHPVRELRRAALHPVLGRAQQESDVHPHRDRARRTDGDRQHADRRDEVDGRRPEARAFRAVAEDVVLSAVLRRSAISSASRAR